MTARAGPLLPPVSRSNSRAASGAPGPSRTRRCCAAPALRGHSRAGSAGHRAVPKAETLPLRGRLVVRRACRVGPHRCQRGAMGEHSGHEPDHLKHAAPSLCRRPPARAGPPAQPRPSGSALGGHLAKASGDTRGPRTPQRSTAIASCRHRRYRRRAVSRRHARRRRRLGRERPRGRRTGTAPARTARVRPPRGGLTRRASADPTAVPRGGRWRARTLPRRPAGAAQRVRGDRTAVPGLSRTSGALTQPSTSGWAVAGRQFARPGANPYSSRRSASSSRCSFERVRRVPAHARKCSSVRARTTVTSRAER